MQPCPTDKGKTNRPWIPCLIGWILASCLALPSALAMTAMEDADLAQVAGHGFSEFSFVDGVATARFAINLSTYTEIDSLKMGLYDNGAGEGWDQDWTNVRMGSPVEDLVLNGLYIRAEFENYGDAANRRLLSLRVGTEDLSGTIAANFNSFSGDIAAGNPTAGMRQTPSFSQINAQNSGFYFSIELAGPNKGFSFHFDQATTQ